MIDSEITVNKFRLLIEKLDDFISLFPLNIPEEILVWAEAMSDAFDCSHLISITNNFEIDLNYIPLLIS